MVYVRVVSDLFFGSRVYDLFYVYYIILILLFLGCFLNIKGKYR